MSTLPMPSSAPTVHSSASHTRVRSVSRPRSKAPTHGVLLDDVGPSWPRVLVHPAGHPLVRRLHGRIARIIQPHGDDDRFADGDWIHTHSLEWDVVHLMLGRDTPVPFRSVEQMTSALRAHRECAVPTVVTVLDLHVDGVPVLESLEANAHLISRVTTLTKGAADRIADATGIRPVVIPHGPVLNHHDLSLARRWRRHVRLLPTDAAPVLVCATDPSEDLDVDRLVAAADRITAGRPLRLLVTPDRAHPLAGGDPQRVERVVMERADDLTIAREMARAEVVVVPLRSGSHSRVVELAADVGVPIVASAVGHLADQAPVRTVPVGPEGIDLDALGKALRRPFGFTTRSPQCQRERAEHAFVAGWSDLYSRVRMGHTVVRSAVPCAPPPQAGQ